MLELDRIEQYQVLCYLVFKLKEDKTPNGDGDGGINQSTLFGTPTNTNKLPSAKNGIFLFTCQELVQINERMLIT